MSLGTLPHHGLPRKPVRSSYLFWRTAGFDFFLLRRVPLRGSCRRHGHLPSLPLFFLPKQNTQTSARSVLPNMAPTTLPPTPVIIIGSGFSGLAMGAQLKRKLGLNDYVIYERDTEFGGTWFANTCKSPSPLKYTALILSRSRMRCRHTQSLLQSLICPKS
jgi:NAD(P)-binding Rossmann-like domain